MEILERGMPLKRASVLKLFSRDVKVSHVHDSIRLSRLTAALGLNPRLIQGLAYLQQITDLQDTAKSTKSLLQSYDKAYFNV